MPIIKKERVVVEEDYYILLSKKAKEPEVIVNQKNDIVESIDVICSCGRKTHIICEAVDNSSLIQRTNTASEAILKTNL